MSILVSPGGKALHLDETLDRLKRLVVDLEALKCGRLPDLPGSEGSAAIRATIASAIAWSGPIRCCHRKSRHRLP